MRVRVPLLMCVASLVSSQSSLRLSLLTERFCSLAADTSTCLTDLTWESRRGRERGEGGVRVLRPRRKAAGEVFQVFTLEAGMIPGRIPFWKAAHIAQVLRRHVYCHVLGPAPHLPSAGAGANDQR